MASGSETFTATIPAQTTDYSATATLPKFDPALGTLNEVDFSILASGNTNGNLTNNSNTPQTFTFQQVTKVTASEGSNTLTTPNLSNSEDYTGLAAGATAAFGPFSPSETGSATLTSGSAFDDFASGPGSIPITVSTLTTDTTIGGGGNINSLVTTQLGVTATVTYKYTYQPVSLSGFVYDDADGTGSKTPTDPPIPGTTLTLLNSAGTVVATTTTDSTGAYSFTTDSSGAALAQGTYEIAETQPVGYLQGTNTVGTVNGVPDGVLVPVDRIGSIVLTPGQSSINNNFGEILPVALSGTVYDDVDGNGALSPGDLPIPGTTLTLSDAAGVVATTTTGANGGYTFTTTSSGAPLPPDTYTISETQPAGYLQGTNTVGTVNGVPDGVLIPVDHIGSIALTSGQSSIGNNFGEVLPVALSGTVYDDVDGNGALSPGDLPIPGTTLTLLSPSGTVVATTSTGANGGYTFTANSSGAPLPPGTYEVFETQPAGYLQGTNTVGTVNGVTDGVLIPVDRIGSIVLNSGQSSIGNNFGEVLPVALSGTVYDDVDRNGVLSPGDLPIPGVKLTLSDSSGVVATTTTNAFGVYSFTATSTGAPIPPGTYSIFETQPAGYLQGTNTVGTVNGVTDGVLSAVDTISSIVLRSAQSSVGNNFGELLPNPPINTAVVGVQRFGVHLQPTLIVLTFSASLDPSTASNVANYQLTGPIGAKVQTPITILSADYDAASRTVTLHTLDRLDLHKAYKLTVQNLKSSTGGDLIGSDGKAGDPFIAVVNETALSGFTDRYGTFIPINHGQLYPESSAAAFHAKHFVPPANLGSFAAENTATFLIATDGKGYHPPVRGHGKSFSSKAKRG